jgi:regulator of extracellular matrix RemA (YlzA/DUF370 family)
MRGEESLIRLSDGNILAANRWFEAVCPKCGPVLQNKMGHHATIQSKRLKKLFPKNKLQALRADLSADEFRRLSAAREGQRGLTAEDMARFRRMVGQDEGP